MPAARSRSSTPPRSPLSSRAGAYPLQRLGPEPVQVERVGDRERRLAGLDRLGVLAGDDQRPGQLGQDEPFGTGGGRAGQQRRRLAQVPHAVLAVALAAQQPAQQRPGLCRPFPVAGLQQRLGRLGEQLGAGQLGVHAGLAEPEQPRRAGRVAGGGQLQRSGVEAGRGVEGVQGGGPVAGLPQRGPGPSGQQLGVLPAGRPGELQRPRVVVGQQLGPVLGPVGGKRGDPLGRPAVLVGPGPPRELPVGDVADQDVAEGVLGLPRHRRAALGAQELAGLEDLDLAPDGLAGPAGQGGQRAQPDHRPEHRGVGQHRLLVGAEGVHPGRDQALHRVRQRPGVHLDRPAAAEQAPVGEHAHVLLGVQRVAAGPAEQLGLQLGGEDAGVEQGGQQPGGVILAEGLQPDDGRVGS